MASYALVANKYRLARFEVELYSLMASVHAGYVTSAAAVAEFIVKYREQYGISFNTVMVYYRACRNAYEILH